MHTTSPRDLLEAERDQRLESGYDLSAVAAEIAAVLADDHATDTAMRRTHVRLLATTRLESWGYVEPDSLSEILESLPATPSRPGPSTRPPVSGLTDRVHGAWLGRVVGCTLGKAIEWGDHWTPDHIRRYLTLADAWPLDDYIPVVEPMPAEFELHDSWPQTTRGNISGSARDDDIDFAMLALSLIEQHGEALRPEHVADAWLTLLPYLATYTAERSTYRNLVDRVPVAEAADVNNPYREWIGAQIRGDVFGYVHPGDPRGAARAAYQDAVLSHRGNGIYGEMWAAGLVAAAFVSPDATTALAVSLDQVPPGSRLHKALAEVLADFHEGVSWEEARSRIGERHGHYSWVHTINNACVVAAGLLWAEGDFSRAICLTVMGGLDTDSNGATAGSVAGVLAGRAAIPARWADPLEDRIRSALAGFDGTRISDLAERTLRLIDKDPA